jgi:hypothetical protein
MTATTTPIARVRDGGSVVARAPVSNPTPGNWKKYLDGRWDQPGLSGNATRLMSGSGVSVARRTTIGDFVLTGWVQGGLGLFLTRDHVSVKAMVEPLLVLDPGSGALRRLSSSPIQCTSTPEPAATNSRMPGCWSMPIGRQAAGKPTNTSSRPIGRGYGRCVLFRPSPSRKTAGASTSRCGTASPDA